MRAAHARSRGRGPARANVNSDVSSRSVASLLFFSPRAIAWTSSDAAALYGVGMPCLFPCSTTSPFRKSTAGVRPRSMAVSMDERIRR